MCPWCGQTRHVFYTWHGTCVTESNTELMATGLQMKKMCENSTLGGEGSGPGHFPHFFFKIKLFKMHFKPFQAILDHVFFSTKIFFPRVPPLDFFQNFKKFSKIFKSYGNCLILGFVRFFKLFLVFFFLKIFHIFGHRGGGQTQCGIFHIFFFFFDGFPKWMRW